MKRQLARDELQRRIQPGVQHDQAGVVDPGLPVALEADVRSAALGVGRDRFGTLARTTLDLPAGKWLLRTLSDDGIRVRVDGELVIDNWTWHGPTRDEGRIELATPRRVRIEVEHFELDGYAVLSLALVPGG